MENVNSVCFVGKIEEIKPIEGADKIVQAIISGWECIIQKDKYKVGQLVVIATTDAVIPFELAEQLEVTNYLKHRKKTNQLTVKTVKLKGVYSSALIVHSTCIGVTEGEDMMETLEITKYEEPDVEMQLSSGRKVRYHRNPNFHVYYKFPNAKNVPDMFSEDDIVVITNKIHGTNARYGIVKKDRISLWTRIKAWFGKEWTDYDYVYGSHNVEKGSDSQGFYSTDVWREIAEKYKIRQLLWNMVRMSDKKTIGEGLILYGEIYGQGIQDRYDYGLRDKAIKFFDIKLNGNYLNQESFERVTNQYSLPVVDLLYRGKFSKEVIKGLENRTVAGSKLPEEGIVVKHVSGSREQIAKYINPAYAEFQSKNENSTDFH